MTAPPQADLDRLVITTPDLAGSHARWTQLGFNLSPRGDHASLGAANHTAMFADSAYLELLCVVEPGPANLQFHAAVLACPDSIGGLAVKIDRAADFQRAHAEGPFRAEQPVSFSRDVELGDRTEVARFTIVRLAGGALFLPSVFACQHHTPDLVWRPELLDHPNGVTALRGAVFAAADPSLVAERFAEMMSRPATPFGLGWAVASEAAFLGFLPSSETAPGLAPQALVFEAGDPARLAKVLTENAVARLPRAQGAILVPPAVGRPFACVFQGPGAWRRWPAGRQSSPDGLSGPPR